MATITCSALALEAHVAMAGGLLLPWETIRMTTQTVMNAGSENHGPVADKARPGEAGRVLIIDDDPVNRLVLRKPLELAGYVVTEADSGEQALRYLLRHPIDTILLDILMPKVDGFELCRVLKRHAKTAHIPVLMVTALSAREEQLKGIESGANDFLSKPVDVRELRLRVKNAVYSKKLYDQLQTEQGKSEALLLNVLPKPIAERMKAGERDIANRYDAVTVVVAELIGVAQLAGPIPLEQVVYLLNEMFSAFDALLEDRGMEKVKTMGGTYLCVAGIPQARSDHAQAALELASEMAREVTQFNAQYNTSMKLRAVLNTGPVIAGVIGRKRFSYDVWGKTVNEAVRLGSELPKAGIYLTGTARAALLGNTHFEELDGAAGQKLFRISSPVSSVQ